MTAVRRRLAGLVSLLLIVGIMVGLPLALLAAGANPLEAGLPTLDSVKNALTTPDDGALFLTLVKIVGWAAWAFLTLSILLEAGSRARGAQAPTLPGLRLPQYAARSLVRAAAMLFVAVPLGVGTATAATGPSTPPAATVTAAGVAGDTSTAAATAEASAAPISAPPPTAAEHPPATVTHTVQRGETLWSIAQAQLGDGHRYREILDLNRDLLGGKPGFLRAGETLTIPATAHPRKVVVERGDTLAEIARDQLGDARRYPEIFQASRSITQPHGAHLTDPDVIDVGWTVQMPSDQPAADQPPTVHEQPPATAPTGKTTPADRTQPDPATTGHHRAAVPPTATQPATPQHAQPPAAPPAPTTAPTTAPTSPARSTAPAHPQHQNAPQTTTAEDHLDEDHPAWVARTRYGVGALLAAGVLALIGTRRRTQQRRRRPGQRMPMPQGRTAHVEQELRATADALSVDVVDVALRSLARHCATAGVPLPAVRAARLTATQFDLYLAEPTALPEPWTDTADSTVWTLSVDTTAEVSSVDVSDVPAPYPALTTVGHDEEDGHVFLDLEYIGALYVAGDPDATREILAALAVELATSTWADDLQVTVVGAFPELEDTLRTGRIRYLPSVGRVLDDLTRRAADDRQALAAEHAPDLHTARVTGAAPDAWPPEIVLVAGAVTDRQRDQLQQLTAELPRVALAAVTAGVRVGEWGLDLTTGDSPDLAVLAPIGLQIRPQRLPAEQYGHLLEIAALSDVEELDGDPAPEPTVAEVDAVTPVDEPAPVPPPPATGPAAAGEDAASLPAEAHSPSTSAGATRPDVDERTVDEPATVEAVTPAAATLEPQPPPAAEPAADEAGGEETPAPPTAAAGPALTTRPSQTPPADEPPMGDGRPEADVTTGVRVDQPEMHDEAPMDDTRTDPPAASGAVATATEPARTSDDATSPQPTPPSSAPRILVLGPVDILNATGQVEPTKRARLLEYAAYLALHPGATHTAVDDAIWPDRKTEDNLNTRNPATSKLRRWVGRSPDGEEYLPRHQAGEGYAFRPVVTTDAGDWDHLLRRDPFNASSEDLEAALTLVRGVPFEGTHRKRYAWAQPLKQRLISEIVDAAFELGRRRLMEGRWRAAEQALALGLRVEPAQETLWRLRILAAHESRNRAAETEAIERLLAITEELECGLEDETEDLLAALKKPGTGLDQLLATAAL